MAIEINFESTIIAACVQQSLSANNVTNKKGEGTTNILNKSFKHEYIIVAHLEVEHNLEDAMQNMHKNTIKHRLK